MGGFCGRGRAGVSHRAAAVWAEEKAGVVAGDGLAVVTKRREKPSAEAPRTKLKGNTKLQGPRSASQFLATGLANGSRSPSPLPSPAGRGNTPCRCPAHPYASPCRAAEKFLPPPADPVWGEENASGTPGPLRWFCSPRLFARNRAGHRPPTRSGFCVACPPQIAHSLRRLAGILNSMESAIHLLLVADHPAVARRTTEARKAGLVNSRGPFTRDSCRRVIAPLKTRRATIARLRVTRQPIP